MKNLLIINDLHIGTSRVGGTTSESAVALRQYLCRKLSQLLCLGSNIVINGDFFDSPKVPLADFLESYQILAHWLDRDGREICLIPGNHCLSKSSMELSSFELLARLLQTRFPRQVRYLQGAGWVQEGVFAISHMPNQTLFDAELAKVPDNAKYLLLHCNYDSVFACDSDHSLNIARDQCKQIAANGTTLILGHEHQARTLLGGKVVITGNQFPASVSDCLGNSRKHCLEITPNGLNEVPTWGTTDKDGGFRQVDWRELDELSASNMSFVRVTGNAKMSEAADVIKSISKYRQRSLAFVVTNAVKVEQPDGVDEIAASVEEIKALSVLDLLMEQLDEKQRSTIQMLLENANV